MEFKKLENFVVNPEKLVKVTEMGNITELLHLSHRNTGCSIKKLNADEYMMIDTGEIKEYNHIENRSESINSVKQSHRKLRAYLNTNITDTNKCLWVTLTYKENMTDTKRLYLDFKNFILRMRYYSTNELKTEFEYIVAPEPQARGAWHCHVVMIFDKDKPYIKNSKLAEIWRHGFVTVKKLENVDNVGAYLTAYLGDMDYDDYRKIEPNKSPGKNNIKSIELTLSNGKKELKKYVKGARLVMYPPGMNIFRKSKGIKEPRSYLEVEKDIKKDNLGGLTFSSAIELKDCEKDFIQTISYRYYNKNIKK